MYTLDDFNNQAYGTKRIVTVGMNYDINYSDILSKLIKECGRLCESYASDLFITWNNIALGLINKDITSQTLLFGIREQGVDSEYFVINRYNDAETYGNKQVLNYLYRKIFRLDITVHHDDLIKMVLTEIDKP